MTVVDIVVIFVIVVSALFGILRGFVRESVSLIKWVLATWIAVTFAPKLSTLLPIDSEAASQATAFGLLFVTILIIGSIATFIVVQFVKKTGLSGADRVFGFLFGFLRGGVIIVVFVVIGQKVSLTNQPWWQDSIMLNRFEDVAILIHDYIPENGSMIDTSDIVNSVDTDKLIEQVVQ